MPEITRKGSLLAGLVAAIAVLAVWYALQSQGSGAIDHTDAELVALGGEVYQQHCAYCHGRELEGEPDWREPLETGGMPAPPHDETGHTWHHPDQLLFDYTKLGGQALIGDAGQSNMPGFGDKLTDREIWAVLSFIKSRWPAEVQTRHDQLNRS